MTHIRFLLLPLFLVSPALAKTPSVEPNAQQTERKVIEITGGFGEGWSQVVGPFDLPYPNETLYKLKVEDGWLHVTRTNMVGEFGWHIVLGRTTEPPEVATVGQTASFEIALDDGRYFIRESGQLLRAVRQRKTSEGFVPKEAVFDDAFESKGWGKSDIINLMVSSWSDGDWFFVASGSDEKRYDAVFRLNHNSGNKGGYGAETHRAGVIRYTHGNTWVVDDGEFLVVSRMPLALHRMMQVRQEKLEAARRALESGDVPPIKAAEWLNTEELNWENLKGKVVLLDFWSTTCGPCIAKFPEVQQLHDEFSSRGLVVIAMHAASNGDSCKGFFAENNYTFPVAVDTGETAENYAVSALPTYFLFDKESKLVQGFDSKFPEREVIESLLEE